MFSGNMQLFFHDKVEEFIHTLLPATKAKLLRSLDLLQVYGQNLGMPHVRPLSNGLFELRVRTQQEVRIFFIFRNNHLILLHGFIKKSQKTPLKEVRLARKRALETQN